MNELLTPRLAHKQANKFAACSLVVEMGGIEPPSNTEFLTLLRV